MTQLQSGIGLPVLMAHDVQSSVHALHRRQLTTASPSKRTCSFSVACTAPRVARSLKALDRRGRLAAVPSSGAPGFLPGVGVLMPGVRVRLLWSASTVCSLCAHSRRCQETSSERFCSVLHAQLELCDAQAIKAAASAAACMPTWGLC